MKYIPTRNIIFSLLLTLVFASCSEQQRKTLSVMEPALGKAGSILVVAEEDVWNGLVGKAFRSTYEKTYAVLPQPETAYEVKHSIGGDFKGILKEWRVIIFLGVMDDESPTSKYIAELLGAERMLRAKEDPSFNTVKLQDPWARGQHVFMFFSQNQAELIQAFQAKERTVKNAIDELDQVKLAANNYQSGHDEILNAKILKDLDIRMDFPKNYELATYDSLANTMWIRKETSDASSNVLIRTMEYTKQEQLTRENLISIRDSIGKQLITTATKDAYMLTEQKHMDVEFEEIDFQGNYAIRAMGLWKMHNDFMGGPFISYLVYNKDLGKLVFLDGFLYRPSDNPNKTKRRPLQQLDQIMNRLEF